MAFALCYRILFSALAALLVMGALATPAAALLRAESEPGFPEVVFIDPLPDGQSYGECSGVVVAPTVVLTAAHCLSAGDFGLPRTLAARVTTFDQPDRPLLTQDVTGYYRNPGYAYPAVPLRAAPCSVCQSVTAASDWGLLFLDAPLAIAPPRRIDELLPTGLRERLTAIPVRELDSAVSDSARALSHDLQAWLRTTFAPDGYVDARVVGFGFGTCGNEITGRDCAGKGVRRSAAIGVLMDSRCGNAGLVPAGDLPVAVLCITAAAGGHVPITWADSGAPIYFRSTSGEWVLAGIASLNIAPRVTGHDAHLAASVLFFMDDLARAIGTPHKRNAVAFPGP